MRFSWKYMLSYKKFLLALPLSILLCITIFSVDAFAMSEPTTVTFQGAVTRHALSDKSIEVSGVVKFYYNERVDGETYSETVEHDFTIPAGQRSIAYSETLDWMIPGENAYKVFTVSVICLINCEEASVYAESLYYSELGTTDAVIYDREEFGLDERDDAYIVNLGLLPSYAIIKARVELPEGKIAEEDIQFNLVSEDHSFSPGSASSWRAQVGRYNYEIKKGQSAVDLDVRVDLVSQLTHHDRDDEFFIGYQCARDACGRAGLLKEGWLGRSQRDTVTDRASAGLLKLGSLVGSDDLTLELPESIQLLARDQLVNVLVTSEVNTSGVVRSGKLIVEKIYYALSCDSAFIGETPIEIDYTQNNRCIFPFLFSKQTIISENDISFSVTEQGTNVAIAMETLANDLFCFSQIDCPTEPSYQTIKFECTSGCDGTQFSDSATKYLAEDGQFTARSESQAKKFYQTEEFFQQDIILSFIPPTIVMPWLELLME